MAAAGMDHMIGGQRGSRRTLPARLLLDEHEVRWEQSSSQLGDDEADFYHRSALVAEALRAYEWLRVTEAPDSDPATVFRRWPICARVALVPAATDEEFVQRARRFFAGEDASRASPTLRLDIATGMLIVEAPAGAEAWWGSTEGGLVRLDGARWVVPRPQPTVTVVDRWGNELDLPLFDPAKPILTFTEFGSVMIGPHVGDAWVLGRDDLVQGFGAALLEVAPPPPGWDGWARARVVHALDDLPDVAWALGEPVVGLVDAAGNPVYQRPPSIELPDRGGGFWTVEVTRLGEESPSITIEYGGEVVDLADHLRLPALGRFRAVARPRRGRSIVTEFSVAEGVDVATPVAFRVFGDGGLRRADATIRSEFGIRAVPELVRLLPTQVSRPVQLRTDTAVLDALVELPHAAIRRRIGGVSEEWGINAVSYGEAELVGPAQLDVRLPDEARAILTKPPGIVAEAGSRGPVQRVQGGRTGAVLRYNMTALLDTAREYGELRVWLDLPGELRVPLADVVAETRQRPDLVVPVGDEVERRQVELDAVLPGIASVTDAPERFPQEDATDLAVHRRGAVLVTPRSSLSAEVIVHLCYAPWFPPLRRRLASGLNTVTLPHPFEEGGPLLVTVVAEGVQPAAGWPGAVPGATPGISVTRLECEGRIPRLDDRGERAMAAYLAGKAEIPNERGMRNLFWTVAARAVGAAGPTRGPLIAQECASRLTDAPTASLLALERAGLSDAEIIGPLIRAGLAGARLTSVRDPDAVRRLLTTNPLAGLVAASPILPYLGEDPMWSVEELEPAEKALLASVVERVDPAALAVLRDPSAPFPTTDVLTSGSVPTLVGDVPELGEPLRLLHDFAARSSHGRLMDAVGPRLADGEPATVAAAVSLGIAIVARLAAQGEPEAAKVEAELRQVWRQLAEQAPQLVAADLALAEFLVTGWLVRHG